ncbi:60 kDa neurofilament protein-like [Ostrea edulis]|uniref:60 kDa neurofilament protein-like n=1 Tax=Ostrea edulis TaxID=37623 RepID=UPI0024AEDE64|nr:60 kDa neurofilament protein-like [Ostrea edulis]
MFPGTKWIKSSRLGILCLDWYLKWSMQSSRGFPVHIPPMCTHEQSLQIKCSICCDRCENLYHFKCVPMTKCYRSSSVLWVNDVIQTRDKEKKDMQGLNERFASYIEKVRFLEAQNKALLTEIERLKKLKGFDVSEIKELNEQEIAESRNVIDELSKEKAKFDSTLVGLQDALDDEKREYALNLRIKLLCIVQSSLMWMSDASNGTV